MLTTNQTQPLQSIFALNTEIFSLDCKKTLYLRCFLQLAPELITFLQRDNDGKVITVSLFHKLIQMGINKITCLKKK